MSESYISAPIEGGELVFNRQLTVGQVRKMSSSEGNIDNVIEVLAAIVFSWPFKGDPKNVASWDDLQMTEFNRVAQVITEELGKGLSG